MFLWFVATAWAGVWLVLHDPTFDYRVLALGAIAPDLIDAPFGGARAMHSITASVALLTLVMLGTIGRRPIRRRLLALPFGTFLHLVFDGAFTDTKLFWWPFASRQFADRSLPSFESVGTGLVREVIGLVILVLWWRGFRLGDPTNRKRLVRTGHLVT